MNNPKQNISSTKIHTKPARVHRLRSLGLAAGFVLASVVATAATPAAATGTTGQSERAVCGWYALAKTNPLTAGSYDYKITRVLFPAVTGTSATPQKVWLHVEFQQLNSTYRAGWYYTMAVAGRWATTWTSYNNGSTGNFYADDAPGESGYVNGGFNTLVKVSVVWPAGSTTAYAYAYTDVNFGHLRCNSGANLF